MVVARNNTRFPIRKEESGKLAGMGVLVVIPAEAGIQVMPSLLDPGLRRGDDVTRTFGQRLRHLLHDLKANVR